MKNREKQAVQRIDITAMQRIDTAECVRLCEAIADFWGGQDQCEAPIWPSAYITEEDVPIKDLIRAAVGWRKP